ncbi:hypothetical protein [Pedosphaera parvula]|uniref:SnoaL-like domain-containing protein n=1 Tax=Pedosphaera parvula (strain Ellin514) TaxID=320771 RepID=B9XG00_PEDPL|nr:hypothetical protein [Pedosphaera parvula]EEF61162.1 hypothetical protein Cflav_PD3879 [Pedosphaera parvula Ellin514]
MKIVVRLVLLVVLAALGYWIYTVLFPPTEVVIRKRLNKIAELASFSSGQGNIIKVANLERLGTYFKDNVEVVVDVPGFGPHTFNQKAELMQAAGAARSTVPSLNAKFIDINVDVGSAKHLATADLTLEASVGGQKDAIVQELKFTLENVNGTWLVARIETVKTLK